MTQEEVFKTIETHYRENFEALCKKIGGRFHCYADAEDVVQEAYYRVLSYSNGYDDSQPFDNYFTVVLNNCCRDKWGDIARHGMSNEISPEDEPIDEHLGTTVIELKAVEKMIEQLPFNHRRIVKLHVYEDYRPADIVKLVPENIKNIKQIIWRFRKSLKEG